MQAAYNPVTMLVYCKLGECADLTIVDSSEYCGEGELISYWELIRRTQEQQDLVLGYYTIPDQIDKPIESVINPQVSGWCCHLSVAAASRALCLQPQTCDTHVSCLLRPSLPLCMTSDSWMSARAAQYLDMSTMMVKNHAIATPLYCPYVRA